MEKTETFICKARKKHGKKYDYSKTVYKDSKTKIIITCLRHGDFLISPGHHTNRGQGCKQCGLKITNTDGIIEKAKVLHGDKYDYSKFIFKDFHTESLVICLLHGEFSITPTKHIHSKQGCKKCGFERISKIKNLKGKQGFMKKLIAVHGDNYDYSEVIYKTSKEYVNIICKKHGKFKVTPNKLLQGDGCKKCGSEKASVLRALDSDTFISRAVSLHGQKYDYSKTIYISSNKQIKIICPEHGEFLQYPLNHLKGHECIHCGHKNTRDSLRKNLDEFISSAQEVHGYKYDYSQVVYTNCKTHVEIVCSTHGSFFQSPTNHQKGSGCPLCVSIWKSKGSCRIEKWLNLNNIRYNREKTFKSLRSSNIRNVPLRFDFFLPDVNVLIEFDGEQHFKPITIWGGEKYFKALVANDEQKTVWAKNNGFNLIRISCFEVDKIENILTHHLQNFYTIKYELGKET